MRGCGVLNCRTLTSHYAIVGGHSHSSKELYDIPVTQRTQHFSLHSHIQLTRSSAGGRCALFGKTHFSLQQVQFLYSHFFLAAQPYCPVHTARGAASQRLMELQITEIYLYKRHFQCVQFSNSKSPSNLAGNWRQMQWKK